MFLGNVLEMDFPFVKKEGEHINPYSEIVPVHVVTLVVVAMVFGRKYGTS